MKRIILAAAATLALAAAAPAQEPSQPLDGLDDRLVTPTGEPVRRRVRVPAQARTADHVLDRYVEVTGGRDAYLKHTSMFFKGKLEVVGAGITGTVENYTAAPARVSSTIVLSGFGTSKEIYDGTHGWAMDPLNGTRELTGAELALLKRQATFNSDVNWRGIWKSVEFVGTKPLGDRTANVVKLTPREGEGNPQTNFYDTETGLLVRTETVVETNSATVPVVIVLSDYREVGGIKMPFTSEQQLPNVTVRTTVTDVTFDTKIDEAVFAKPQ